MTGTHLFRPQQPAYAFALLGLVACSAPAQHAALAVVATEAAAVHALDAGGASCRFDLLAQRLAQPETNSVTGDDGIGAVLVRWSGEGSGDVVFASFDARNRDGHEAGTLEYVCTHDGLQLRRVESTAGAVSFAPALVVLPADEGSGASVGVVGTRTAALSTALEYTHRWSARPAPPLPALAGLDASWVLVESELLVTGEATPRSWQTSTLWAITAAGHFFVAATEQVERGGSAAGARTEQVETVRTATDSPRW